MSPVLTAQEALALGMVTKVVPDADIDGAARELAMSLAQGPSVMLGYIKRNINNAEHMSLEACSMLRRSIIRAPARPPTTRKPRRRLSKSESLFFTGTDAFVRSPSGLVSPGTMGRLRRACLQHPGRLIAP